MAKKPKPDNPDSVKLWDVELRDPAKLKPHPKNPHTHPEAQVAGLAGAMQEFGLTSVLVVDENNQILAGHARTDAAGRKNVAKVQAIVVRGWSERKKIKFMLSDNRWPELAGYDDAIMRELLSGLQTAGEDMASVGYDAAALAALLAPPYAPGMSLAERFGVVPFSVISARDGWWQDRKRAWLELGIQSEIGRGENLLKFSDAVALDGNTYKARAAFKQPSAHKRGGGIVHLTKSVECIAGRKAAPQAKDGSQ